jgi:formate dehydrogenase iron-sulfur subunit
VTVTDLTPIDIFLAEQADLTAVERFSRYHETEDAARPDRFYRDLIPIRDPAPGEQFGFEVDLDACTGCKACVTACHNLNGLDEGESWRSVGLLHGSNGRPDRQTVTTACHHCIDPACLNGCPANAYTKDPATGIVKHLDDQCIGCGYCIFTCPYEVPKYNERLGIVRKCDMCHDRLASGEAPACVQGCPNGAIRIMLVDRQGLIETARTGSLVPDAPSSHVTVPSTTYRSDRTTTNLIAVDHYALRPSQPHPPLAVMLVLTQLSVGAFACEVLLGSQRASTAILALALGVLAMGASVFHLGRPLYAFRAALGFGHSWLSREIVAFGAFSALASVYAFVLLTGLLSGSETVLGGLVVLAGVGAVACSVMVYVVTGRTWWRARTVAPKFFLSAASGGGAAVLLVSSLVGADVRPIARVVLIGAILKLAIESSLFLHLFSKTKTDLRRTALLLTRDLASSTGWRFLCGALGGLVLPLLVLAADRPLMRGALAGTALICIIAGELIERSQFFRALVSPRMPGELS